MGILTEGFPTKVTFTSAELTSGVVTFDVMNELEVTPPGIAGGGANDTTGMRNIKFRTRHPKKLVTLTSSTLIIKFDPAVYDEMIAMVNDNQAITVTFSNDATLVFWGWVDSFTPDACVEGAQPTATVVMEPSNMDADDNNAEKGPVYSAA